MKALVLFIIFYSHNCYGQNLVPNSSFEDENICEYDHRPCNPSGWFNISQGPHGYKLDQTPGASGAKWINVIVGNRIDSSRQYWQTALLNPLEKGRKYSVSLSIHGGGDPDRYPMDIGLYFSDSMLSLSKDGLLQPGNYIKFTDATIKQLKNGWFSMQKEYVATANSKVIAIGNFSGDDYHAIAKKRTSNSKYLTVKVDNVEVIPIGHIPCENCMKVKDSLYAINRRHSPLTIARPVDTEPFQTGSQVTVTKVDSIVLENLFFDIGSAVIEDENLIDEYAPIFTRDSIVKIEISGFTDDVGSDADNLRLSEKRAIGVSELLKSKFQIKPELIKVRGKGISKKYQDPKKNRRVEIFVYH
jgi:outer membrane protein OmpA-like peptidoglycan-associated protein